MRTGIYSFCTPKWPLKKWWLTMNIHGTFFQANRTRFFFPPGGIILLHVSVVLVILHVLLVTFLFIEAYSLWLLLGIEPGDIWITISWWAFLFTIKTSSGPKWSEHPNLHVDLFNIMYIYIYLHSIIVYIYIYISMHCIYICVSLLIDLDARHSGNLT